ncbi:hypothetical protein P20311_3524 [Pseudoalteromonas sp. BSi20311]|nr:hypothetical protein P20311_3524 [Pseudoalteromonas sp. BSi20311]
MILFFVHPIKVVYLLNIVRATVYINKFNSLQSFIHQLVSLKNNQGAKYILLY